MKGEISDVALLFNDPEPKIQSLVKLFFHELHKKDPKLIYNLLPEAIGRLSKDDIEVVVLYKCINCNNKIGGFWRGFLNVC